MNQIKDVYARISADESVVNTAIEKAKQQKIKRLPVGRIAAIAAGFVAVILAVSITSLAKNQRSAFSLMADYDKKISQVQDDAVNDDSGALQEEDQDGANYSAGSGSGSASNGVQMYARSFLDAVAEYALPLKSVDDVAYGCDGLWFSPQEAYYDGEYLMVSFSGSYEGKYDSVERFDYAFGDGEDALFTVNGRNTLPAYGEFYLLETDDGFAGVLTAYCDEETYAADSEILDVRLVVPYLRATATPSRGGSSIEAIFEGPFDMSFQVRKSYDKPHTYEKNPLSISSESFGCIKVFSSAAGTAVECFVGKHSGIDPDAVRLALYDEDSKANIPLIDAIHTRDEDGNVLIKAHFEPVSSDAVACRFYIGEALAQEETLTLS